MENSEITDALETLPDLVADALLAWKTAEANAERCYAKEYLETKARAGGEKITMGEIEATVRGGDAHYLAKMETIKAESEYTRLKERLYAAKRLAEMRSAF